MNISCHKNVNKITPLDPKYHPEWVIWRVMGVVLLGYPWMHFSWNGRLN